MCVCAEVNGREGGAAAKEWERQVAVGCASDRGKGLSGLRVAWFGLVLCGAWCVT